MKREARGRDQPDKLSGTAVLAISTVLLCVGPVQAMATQARNTRQQGKGADFILTDRPASLSGSNLCGALGAGEKASQQDPDEMQHREFNLAAIPVLTWEARSDWINVRAHGVQGDGLNTDRGASILSGWRGRWGGDGPWPNRFLPVESSSGRKTN